MSQWDYVVLAYGIGIGGTLGLIGWTYWRLRVAEKRAEAIKRK